MYDNPSGQLLQRSITWAFNYNRTYSTLAGACAGAASSISRGGGSWPGLIVWPGPDKNWILLTGSNARPVISGQPLQCWVLNIGTCTKLEVSRKQALMISCRVPSDFCRSLLSGPDSHPPSPITQCPQTWQRVAMWPRGRQWAVTIVKMA